MYRTGGFFFERWGDAPVHSLAAAMFLNSTEVCTLPSFLTASLPLVALYTYTASTYSATLTRSIYAALQPPVVFTNVSLCVKGLVMQTQMLQPQLSCLHDKAFDTASSHARSLWKARQAWKSAYSSIHMLGSI